MKRLTILLFMLFIIPATCKAVTLGEYKGTPMTWTTYSTNSTDTVLVSDNIIELKEFDNDTNVWVKSSLYKWLTTTFLKESFTDTERKTITNISILTEDMLKNSGWSYGAKVSDTIKSEYSNSDEVDLAFGNYWWYWLRDPVKNSSSKVSIVSAGGLSSEVAFIKAMYINDDKGGVRPVITIKKSTPSKWATAPIVKATLLKIIPDDMLYTSTITREEFCIYADKVYNLLYPNTPLAKDSVKFSDTSNPAIIRMANRGIINGVSDTRFNPKGKLTREEAATIINKICKYKTKVVDLNKYTDSKNISTWAKTAIMNVISNNIMTGKTTTTFSPKSNLTNEEAVIILYRLLK